MNYSQMQLQAINESGQNILVSAGAGSGKTSVLTARVINLLKKGIHIDELLILTFTNAAAKEMKERIRNSISKEATLQDELLKLDESFICTFDSFALFLVKKYHYLLNIPSNPKITDNTLIDIDGTEDKSVLGANATIATSMAIARVASRSLGIPLFTYIGGLTANRLPVPMLNILNGGKHAANNLSIQEFMIVPKREDSFLEMIKKCVKVYNTLKNILIIKGYSVGVGDEGGFAPNLDEDEDAIKYIIDAIIKSGFEPGQDFGIALDIAATEMKNEAVKIAKDGYLFWKTDKYKSSDQMIDYLVELIDKYPIISIEDGLAEDDWKEWADLQAKIGNKIMIVGDDLYVTNQSRLVKGIKQRASNSILIKPNQIGTVTETIDTIKIAKTAGMKTIVSHRSGETEDTFISDLAVGCGTDYIKTGAPARTDRVAKYNRLLNIDDILRN